MSRLSRSVLLAFAAAVVAGSCLHFVYDLFPCPVTALFAPVSESLWEHAKLLYWPTLISGLLLKDRLGARAFSLLAAAGLMLGAGWLWHGVLGGESLLFDVVLYVACMGLFFLLPALLRGPFWQDSRKLWAALAAVLLALVILFTWLPPEAALFRELP